MTTKCTIPRVSHILDDFIIVSSPDAALASRELSTFLQLANDIKIPIKESKTCLPSTCAIVHGMEMDTNTMEIRLPADKLQKASSQLSAIKSKRRVKLATIQSIVGLLNFACKAIIPGRSFLRRLIDLTKGAKFQHHHISVSAGARADIAVWEQFLQKFNGKTLMLDFRWQTSQNLDLFTDAAGSVGCAGFCGKQWFALSWPMGWSALGITFLELFPIVVAVITWSENFTNNCITFHTDNLAVTHIINNQTSKNPAVMVLVRKLVTACMIHNILFRAEYVPGLLNDTADALSRLQFQKARQLAPWLDPTPTPVPQHVHPENLQLRPSWLRPSPKEPKNRTNML